MSTKAIKACLSLMVVAVVFGLLFYLANLPTAPKDEANLLEAMGCTTTGKSTTQFVQSKAAPDDKYSVAPVQITYFEYTCPSGKNLWMNK